MKLTEAALKALILEALEDEEEESFSIDQEEIDNLMAVAESAPEMALDLYQSLIDDLSEEQQDQIKYVLANALYKGGSPRGALEVLFPEEQLFEPLDIIDWDMDSVQVYPSRPIFTDDMMKELQKAEIPVGNEDIGYTGRLTVGEIVNFRQEILSMATQTFGMDFGVQHRWDLFIHEDTLGVRNGSISRRRFVGDKGYPSVDIWFSLYKREEASWVLREFKLEIKNLAPEYSREKLSLTIVSGLQEDLWGTRSEKHPAWTEGKSRYILLQPEHAGRDGYVTAQEIPPLVESVFGVEV